MKSKNELICPHCKCEITNEPFNDDDYFDEGIEYYEVCCKCYQEFAFIKVGYCEYESYEYDDE